MDTKAGLSLYSIAFFDSYFLNSRSIFKSDRKETVFFSIALKNSPIALIKGFFSNADSIQPRHQGPFCSKIDTKLFFSIAFCVHVLSIDTKSDSSKFKAIELKLKRRTILKFYRFS